MRKRNRAGIPLKYVMIFLIALQLSPWVGAQDGPQQPAITIRFAQQTLPQCLKQLQEATHILFAYDENQLQHIIIKPVTFSNAPIQKVMQVLLKGTGFDYSLVGNNIVINKKAAPVKRDQTAISGKIIDEENGEPVIGATIKTGTQTVTSNVDGTFSIQLPAGKYTAEVSAVSYGAKKVTGIDISNEQVFELNITLKRQKGQLAGVVVTASARRESTAALFARQRNAAGITNGISAEQMGRTPDKNIGEVLKRISGVATIDNKYVVVRGLGERYNQAMLNGQIMPSTELNRKQFSFDIIPSNLVEHVTVYKSITPDLSAEFGGGMVAVTTQSIPSEDFLSVTAGASYNDKTTGKEFKGLLIDNKVYTARIPDNRKLMGANWNSRKDILAGFDAGKVSNNWALYNYTPNPSQNYQVAGGKVISLKNDRKLGFTGSLSYRNTWQTQDVRMGRNGYDGMDTATAERAGFTGRRYGFTSNIGALAGVGYTTSKHKIAWQTIYLRTLDQQFVFGTGSNDPVGAAVGYFDLFTQTRLWQNQLRGEHLLNKKGMKLNWLGSYTLLDRQRPDNHIMNASYAGKGMDSPHQDIDFSISAGQSDLGDGALRSWSRAYEKNYNWNIDFTAPFKFNIKNIAFLNAFKTGYAGWSRDRFFWVFNTGNGYPTGNYQPLTEYFDSTLHTGPVIRPDEFGDDVHKTARLHAGYAMMDNKIGNKLRLVWGVRAEYYNLNYVNVVLDSLFAHINQSRGGSTGMDKYDYSALLNREPNWNFFPSANITYSLIRNMNLRLAYAKSIIRPDLRESSYFMEYDFELGGIYWSQSPVRSTILHHYDIRYEWYPGPGETVSLSYFYKKMDYPMEIYKQSSNRIYELRNNKAAKNKGIEVEVRKTLAFTKLPVLRNITLYGNFTWLEGVVTPMTINYNGIDTSNPLKVIPREEIGPDEKRPQSGASNYMVNAALYYDIKPLSFSLSYNYVSNRMFRPSQAYRESLFERPLEALDAQINFHLLKQKMQIRCNVGNLLNSKSLVYWNVYDNQDVLDGKRPPSVKETLYQKGDAIDYEAKPGRTYSLTVSYRF